MLDMHRQARQRWIAQFEMDIQREKRNKNIIRAMLFTAAFIGVVFSAAVLL